MFACEVRGVGQRPRLGGGTLHDVSLSVGYGEFVAILGGGECGKRELLEVIGGIRRPAEGTVDWDQPDPRSGNVGYVPGAQTLPSALPLARALRYTAALRGLPGAAVGAALETAGLSGRAAAGVGDLTAAERRRAAIAAGLLGGPGLVCLDEPASGLDPAGGAAVLRLLRDLAQNGTAVVLTAHCPADAERADKVAVLADGGHLAFFGSPAAAREYFAADGMDEICERLAGAGDPAVAWARRYAGASPGGRPLRGRPTELSRGASPGPPTPDARPIAETAIPPGARDASTTSAARPGAGRKWAVLAARDADVLVRGWGYTAVLLGGPLLAALVTLTVLFRARGAGAPLLWAVFSGFFSGLAWGLPRIFPERPVLRHEPVGAGAYLMAKVTVLLPPLAAADAGFLALLSLTGGWPGFAGFGAVYLTVLLCSAAALGLGLLVSAAVPPARGAAALPVAAFPLLLAAFGVARGHAAWPDWLLPGLCAVAFLAATAQILARLAR